VKEDSRLLSPLHFCLTLAGVGSTIAVNPWTAFDPINLPKMLVLAVSSFGLIPILFFGWNYLWNRTRSLLFLCIILMFCFVITFLIHMPLASDQFWGSWGRATGLLTYTCLVVLCLSSALFAYLADISRILSIFVRLGYFITGYTVVQLLELDPINWSQKGLFATLGNINFMSSFLGLTTLTMLTFALGEKTRMSSRTFYVAMGILNIYLILTSKSIQGLAIILTGITTITVLQLLKRELKLALLGFSLSAGFLGLLVLSGAAGQGPLGRFLVQETVLFRLDYWKAGFAMTLSNPLYGVGIDQYGDYYREYRDQLATERTGPSRVSNTAHNIFLDISSGSGVPSGFIFLFLNIVAIILLFRSFQKRLYLSEVASLIPLMAGSQIFLLISINQIGVGVWIFMFIGLSFGVFARKGTTRTLAGGSSQSHSKKVNSEVGRSSLTLKQIVPMTALFSIIGLAISLPPNFQDARFLRAAKSQDLVAMQESSESLGGLSFHREKLIEYAIKQGRTTDAVTWAMEEVAFNPRSYFAWSTIVFYGDSLNLIQREEASKMLIELDPSNSPLRTEIQNLWKRLG